MQFLPHPRLRAYDHVLTHNNGQYLLITYHMSGMVLSPLEMPPLLILTVTP